jgi:hypothetical protein
MDQMLAHNVETLSAMSSWRGSYPACADTRVVLGNAFCEYVGKHCLLLF